MQGSGPNRRRLILYHLPSRTQHPAVALGGDALGRIGRGMVTDDGPPTALRKDMRTHGKVIDIRCKDFLRRLIQAYARFVAHMALQAFRSPCGMGASPQQVRSMAEHARPPPLSPIPTRKKELYHG